MPPINIHVLEAASGGENAGTFIEPHPKIKVSTNAAVNFNLINGGASFKVRFNGFQSPFVSGDVDIDQTNAQQTTSTDVERYHYAISVTKGSNTWTIEDCPELDVG